MRTDPSILISSRDDGFFEFVEGQYNTLRRAGLDLRLATVESAAGVDWAVLAPPQAIPRARSLAALEGRPGEPVAETAGRDELIGAAGIDRSFEALLWLRRGESLARIAASLPNRRGTSAPAVGVSEKTVELILRGACRVLLTGVMLDRQPDGLPDELWPPAELREEVRDTPAGLSRRARLEALRAWIEGRRSTGAATATDEPGRR